MKLRKEFKSVLEHILDVRYGNYVNLQKLKETKVEVLTSIDGTKYEHKLDQNTIEQLDGMIKSAHQKYLDTLQLVVELGYESFTDDEASKFCDSGRVHRIFSKEELENMEVVNSTYTLEDSHASK